jgi:hypothetical protein
MSGPRSIMVVVVSFFALILPSIASAESEEVEPPEPARFLTVGNGVIAFNRAFAAPISCHLLTIADGTHSYTLTGFLNDVMDQTAVNRVSVHLNINTRDADEYFEGSTLMADNTSIVDSVPEPSTLFLFSTGVLGLLGMMWRRMSL